MGEVGQKELRGKLIKLLLTVFLFAFSNAAFSENVIKGDLTVGETVFKTFVAGTTTIIEGDLIIGNAGAVLNINAKVIVKGNVYLKADIDFNMGSKVEVYGDFLTDNGSNLDINADAQLIVAGNFIAGDKTGLILRRNCKSIIIGGDLIGNNLNIYRPKNVWPFKYLNEAKYNSNLYILGNKSSFDAPRVNVYGEDKLPSADADYMEDLEDKVYENALPITLINFEAETFSDYNHLKWATASESNNDYFTIYKSADGVNWDWLAEESSVNSNSSTRTDYEFIDNNVESGITYYKLEQTDFDGTTETSKVISVESNVEAADFVITKNGINVTFTNPSETQTVTITSVQGSVLYKKSFTGVYDAFIETNNLTKGVYIISLHTLTDIVSQTFVW